MCFVVIKERRRLATRNRNQRRAGRLQEQGGAFESWVTCMALCTEAWNRAHFRVVVQLPSCVQLFANPWTAAHQDSLCLTISWSLPKFRSIESVIPSNHLIVYRPLLLLPLILPSIRVFSTESAVCISWPKYWDRTANAQQWGIHWVLLPYYALALFFYFVFYHF